MENIKKQLNRIENYTKVGIKDILTTEEVALYTGLSQKYIYQLVWKKAIPHYKSKGGKCNYFDKKEISNWLKYHKVSTKDENLSQAITNSLTKRKGVQNV